MAKYTRRQFAATLAFATVGASSGGMLSRLAAAPCDRWLDITFHGLWVFYRDYPVITAYAFTDPGKEHCFASAWFSSDIPDVKCLETSPVSFQNLRPLDPGANVFDFDDHKNIFLDCNYASDELLKKARVAIILPQWPASINSLRPASMQDVANNPHPGSLVQRLSYCFRSGDAEPTISDSSIGWKPAWSAGRANIHFFAEPDNKVAKGHAVMALNDVVTNALGLEKPEFNRAYEGAAVSDKPQEESLLELKVKCPCRPVALSPRTPQEVANCMGIIVPSDPGITIKK